MDKRSSLVSVAVAAALAVTFVASPGFPLQSDDQQDAEETPQAEVPLVIPEEASQRQNPVPASVESIDYGKLMFSSQCSLCHGKAGDGTGRLVERLGLQVPDFTDPAQLEKRTDGDLFYILTHGHGRMPAQADRFKDKVKWDLINYIRSLKP